jgi:phenylpyruvate tautomerase PptA (4-oxalocrotonate tautomerase family)
MPLLKLQTSATVSDEKQQTLIAATSKLIAETIGKPEQYVMVTLETKVPIMMAGKQGDAAFADVRSIGGLNNSVNKEISQKLAAALQEHVGVAADRVYLNFTAMTAENWGWRGGTFG